MAAILYRGGRVYSPADPHASALLTVGDRIVWLGVPDDCPQIPDRVVELDGALLAPAFVDAHVHITDTGLALLGLDLSTVASAGQLLAAVEQAAGRLPAGALLLGRAGGLALARPSFPELYRELPQW